MGQKAKKMKKVKNYIQDRGLVETKPRPAAAKETLHRGLWIVEIKKPKSYAKAAAKAKSHRGRPRPRSYIAAAIEAPEKSTI